MWGFFMIIREAIIGDEVGLAKVHIDTWLSTYIGLVSQNFLNQLDYRTSAQNWKSIINENNNILLVAENEKGGIVGYAFGGKNRIDDRFFEGELYALYILKASQRKGVGKLLFKSFINKLVEKGFGAMIVWVLKGNPYYKFYERMGGIIDKEKIINLDGVDYTEISYIWRNIDIKHI